MKKKFYKNEEEKYLSIISIIMYFILFIPIIILVIPTIKFIYNCCNEYFFLEIYVKIFSPGTETETETETANQRQRQRQTKYLRY